MERMTGINMNWYKKSQKNITVENIIWAIDKIFYEEYDFSMEELIQASQELGYNYSQQSLPKAAQALGVKNKNITNLSIDPLTYKILELYDRAMNSREIAQTLGLTTPEVAKVLKEHIGSKFQQQQEWRKRHKKNILDTTRQLSNEMRKDLNVDLVTFKKIGAILNLSPKFVSKILTENNISLSLLPKERKEKTARMIAEIANNWEGDISVKQIVEKFNKRHNVRLSPTNTASLIKLYNLGKKTQRDTLSIFTAFKSHARRAGISTLEKLVENPEKIPILLDNFFIEYGKNYGFITPVEKENLRKMLMTKIQIREKTTEQAELGSSFSNYVSDINLQNKIIELMEQNVPVNIISKQTGITPENIQNFYRLYKVKKSPIVTDESHPSYFLNNPEK